MGLQGLGFLVPNRHRQADPQPLANEDLKGSRANERAVAADRWLFRSAVDADLSALQQVDVADEEVAEPIKVKE